MRALDEDVYRTVERQLYNYHRTRQQVQEQRADILYGAAVGSEVIGRASVRADPTAQKVISMDRLPDQKWIKVIDFVQLRYQHSRKGQLMRMCYYENWHKDDICSALEIEPPTYYRWKEELVWCVAFHAALNGLFTKKT